MIYFDSAATTSIDMEVADYINEIQKSVYGNPSSIHQLGQKSKAIIEKSRRQVAQSLNSNSGEIYFTGGGTESNNLVLRGLLKPGDHFITSSIEHPAILKTAIELEKFGIDYSLVEPDQYGEISIEKISGEIKSNTKLVSIMYVNNELGTINNIPKIGEVLKSKNILFHTDAVQAVGKLKINLNELNCDFLSASAHKFHGPKGVGVLYIKEGLDLIPQITGGGQEKNLRAGTENISGIAGLGLALKIATENLETKNNHIKNLENKLLKELNIKNLKFRRNGKNPVSGLCNITFFGALGQTLLVNLDLAGIAISYGAACASGSTKPSSIYSKINIPIDEAECTVRISICRFNTEDEILTLSSQLSKIIPKIKKEKTYA